MTRVEETPVANKSLPKEPARLPEPQRQQELLHHLWTGRLNDVPPYLLQDPWRDTWPFVKLAAGYDAVWQVFLRQISLIEFIRALIGFTAVFVGFMASLATLLAALNPFPGVDLALPWTLLRDAWGPPLAVPASLAWLRQFHQIPSFLTGILAGSITVVGVLLLRDRLSLARDAVILDLNCLYVGGAAGHDYVSWRNVIAVSCEGKSWIRVRLEDGVVALLRIPQADRGWLVEIMRQLLRHHHRDLYGTVPDKDPPCCPPPTEPHPKSREADHSQ